MTDTEGNGGASWRDAEIAKLLAGYFGEKLGLPRVVQAFAQMATALAGRNAEADPVQSETAGALTGLQGQIPPGGNDEDQVEGEGNHGEV